MIRQNSTVSNSLASEPAVSAFIYQVLTIASAGSMTESRAKELYDEIMGCYAYLDAAAYPAFKSEFLKILNLKA